MNKKIIFIICFITICSSFLFSQTDDAISLGINSFSKQELQEFNTLDCPQKNNNISFVMKFPKNYSSKDGLRTHILKQYTSEKDNFGGYISSNIQITGLTDELKLFSETEITEYLFSEEILKETYPSAKIIYHKRTKYEGNDGQIIMFIQQTERAGVTINMIGCIQQFLYKKSMVSINTFYASFGEQLYSEKQLQQFLLFNTMLGNSIIIKK